MLRCALSELSLEGEAIGAGELFVALEPRRHDHVVAVRASERDRGRLDAMVGAHKHRGPAFDGLYRALRHEQRCGAAARKLDRRRLGLAHAPMAGAVVVDAENAPHARGFTVEWGCGTDKSAERRTGKASVRTSRSMGPPNP